MRNRMLARVPKGLRPAQRSSVVIVCPWSGNLAPRTARAVELAPGQPYGQGGRSFEVAGFFAEMGEEALVRQF